MKKNGDTKKQEHKGHAAGDWFHHFAIKTSRLVGSPWCFIGATSLIIAWAILGPVFHFADTWQLVINTATTIITFLMVFLIQNTQNRDAKALHLKLDELIYCLKDARNKLIDLEDMSEAELDALQKEFEEARKEAEGERGKSAGKK